MKLLQIGDLVRAWAERLGERRLAMTGIVIQIDPTYHAKSPGYGYPDRLSPYLVRWGDGTSDWMCEEFLEKILTGSEGS